MMIPDSCKTEQMQVKRILERWSRIERPLFRICKIAYLMVLFSFAFSDQRGNLGRSVFFIALLGLSSLFLYIRLSRFAIRQFAVRLTEEEKTLLRNAIINTTIDDNRTIKDLLIASQKQGTHKADLLRASQPPSDNTLLRPSAAQTESTSAQQLLRAAPEEEIQAIGA